MKKTYKLIKVIYKKYWDFPYQVAEINEGDRMIDGQRVSGLMIFMDTPENRKLASNHNQILKEMESVKSKLFQVSAQLKNEYKP